MADQFQPDDANIDTTYDRQHTAFGHATRRSACASAPHYFRDTGRKNPPENKPQIPCMIFRLAGSFPTQAIQFQWGEFA